MTNLRATTPSLLRIDTSRSSEYIMPEPPKKTFMQKVGSFFGKVLGPIASAVTAFVPGFGLPLSAGIYGLSRIASDASDASISKSQATYNAQVQELSKQPITLPGFFDGQSQNQIQTDFIAPSEYHSGIQNTIITREQSQYQNLQNF